MDKPHISLHADNSGKLPNFSNQSCFEKVYTKLLIKLIGHRSVIMNVNVDLHTAPHSCIREVHDGVFHNFGTSTNVLITQRSNV